VAETPLDTARIWVEFADPADTGQRFRCDLTWLTSSWTCIFGNGCHGIYADRPDDGCCTLGAHFTDDDDVARVGAAAKELGEDEWQYHPGTTKQSAWTELEDDALKTKVVDGACIFLNRPGFPGGPGCALHRTAIERGVPHLELKPDVCWQLPLRRDEQVDGGGHVTSTIREWDRRHWGAGGDEFAWWCTESPDAFVEAEPVYKTLRDELIALTSPHAYKMLSDYLDKRVSKNGSGGPLPHPAERPVKFVRKKTKAK
jgi:hypothetical protein